jgi:hypothetical protein
MSIDATAGEGSSTSGTAVLEDSSAGGGGRPRATDGAGQPAAAPAAKRKGTSTVLHCRPRRLTSHHMLRADRPVASLIIYIHKYKHYSPIDTTTSID